MDRVAPGAEAVAAAVHCPRCKGRAIARAGSAPGVLWRRLRRRNRYLCHPCGIWWVSAVYDGGVPRVGRPLGR